MLRRNDPVVRGVSSEGGRGSTRWEGFVKYVGFEPGVKEKRSYRWYKSGESSEDDDMTGAGRDGQGF